MTFKNLFNKALATQCGLLFLIFSMSICRAFGQQTEVNLFAHRGGVKEYDENTMQAFQSTYDKGVRGYEIDVRLTKDNQLVLFHDADLKRIVGVEGSIEQLTLSQIKRLRTKKGNPIPSLEEALTFFNNKSSLYIEFEMKTMHPAYDEKALKIYCDLLYHKVYASRPSRSNYVLTSFDKRPLHYLKSTYPSVDLMFIKGAGLSQQVLDEAREMGVSRVACNISNTNRATVKEAQKQGFKVTLWPGHSISDFLLGVSLGSDYLCTDIPVEIITWVNKNSPWIKIK